MPRGYRCVLVAFVGWLSFIASASSQAQKQQTIGAQPASADKPHKPKSERIDLAGLPGPVERAIRNPNPRNEAEHINRDLAAQEASATWGFWVVAASLLQAIISAVGIYFIIQTLRQGRMSIRTAFSGLRQAGRQSRAAEAGVAETLRVNEAEMRPFLFIDRIKVTIKNSPGRSTYDATVIFKNYGKLPAREIKVQCSCYFLHLTAKLRRAQGSITDVPVCAHGHERLYFVRIDLDRWEEGLLEEGWGEIILQLKYSYSGAASAIYTEAFDYVFDRESFARNVFFVLASEGRQRRAKIRGSFLKRLREMKQQDGGQ